MRTCRDCRLEKSLDDFPRDKNRALGRGYICKPCMAHRTKLWYRANKEKSLETGKRWREANREKQRASSRKHYAKNAERLRSRSRELNARPEGKARSRREWLKRKYGLTPDQWTHLFQMQQGACAICRSPSPGSKRGWHTDHDHRTHRVRGILCHSCNVMLGAARDSVTILDLGKAYLRAYS